VWSEITEALPDAALVVTPEGLVSTANALARDALHLDPVGLPIASVLRGEAFVSTFAESRKLGHGVSVEIELHSMPPRQFLAHIAPLGTDGAALVMLRDFTREQAVEKMRSDFVANASHEMRTPLSSIIASIETLQGAARNDPAAQQNFLTLMLTQAQRMKRLIDDQLTLSRIELNEHVRPTTRVSLSDVVRQACGNLQALAKEYGVEISVDYTGPCELRGNSDELLQVAQNLIENAIKYGGSGGRVAVSCETQSDAVVLQVRDWGLGIASVHLPRLTERFYRVSTKESRARGGTGLGLAIVKHILLRHRGNLDIASEPGHGSTFTVRIPQMKS
jgi:two-component system phosphate regulon sensor histidine kinase PhoR